MAASQPPWQSPTRLTGPPIRSAAASTSARTSSIPASRVSAVAPFHSSAYARVRPASRIVRIWLWRGEKSTIEEWWAACGGRTSVGTTASVAPSVKSRRTVSGVSAIAALGECHRGGRRSLATRFPPARSSAACNGGQGADRTRRHQAPSSSTAAVVARIASVAIRSGRAPGVVSSMLGMRRRVAARALAVAFATPDRRRRGARSGGRSDRSGAPEVEALAEVDAGLAQRLGGRAGLDELGDRRDVVRVRGLADRPHDGAVARGRLDVAREAAVDLQPPQRHAARVVKGAERHARTQQQEPAAAVREAVRGAALRQRPVRADHLDDEPLGDVAIAAQQRDSRIARGRVVERRRRQADREVLAGALAQKVDHALEQPAVDRGDEAGALGDRQEDSGEDELAVLVVHAQAELRELDRAVVEPRDGLAVDEEAGLVEPAPQPALPAQALRGALARGAPRQRGDGAGADGVLQRDPRGRVHGLRRLVASRIAGGDAGREGYRRVARR